MAKFNTQYLIQSIKFIPKSDLKSHELSILCALISYGNVRNKIPVPQEMLANFTRTSINTVNKYTLSLVKKGFIKYTSPIHYTHKSCNVYTLNLEKIYQYNPYKSPSSGEKSPSNESDIALKSNESRPQMRSKSPSPRGNLDCNRQSTEEVAVALPNGSDAPPETDRNQKQELSQDENIERMSQLLGVPVDVLKAQYLEIQTKQRK